MATRETDTLISELVSDLPNSSEGERFGVNTVLRWVIAFFAVGFFDFLGCERLPGSHTPAFCHLITVFSQDDALVGGFLLSSLLRLLFIGALRSSEKTWAVGVRIYSFALGRGLVEHEPD